MRVRAIALGYYDHKRRRPGAVFDLKPVKRMKVDKAGKPIFQKDGKTHDFEMISPEKQFSSWMEKVDASASLTPEAKAQVRAPAGSPDISEEEAEQDVI